MTDEKNCKQISDKYFSLLKKALDFLVLKKKINEKGTREKLFVQRDSIIKNMAELRELAMTWNGWLQRYEPYAEQSPKKFPEKKNYREVESFQTGMSGNMTLLPYGNLFIWDVGKKSKVALFSHVNRAAYEKTDEFDTRCSYGVCAVADGNVFVSGRNTLEHYRVVGGHRLDYIGAIDGTDSVLVMRLSPDDISTAIATDINANLVELHVEVDESGQRFLECNTIDGLVRGESNISYFDFQMLPNGNYIAAFREKSTGIAGLAAAEHVSGRGFRNHRIWQSGEKELLANFQINPSDGLLYAGRNNIVFCLGNGDSNDPEAASVAVIYEPGLQQNWKMLSGNRVITTNGKDIKIWRKDDLGEYKVVQEVKYPGTNLESMELAPDGRIFTFDEEGIVRIFDGQPT